MNTTNLISDPTRILNIRATLPTKIELTIFNLRLCHRSVLHWLLKPRTSKRFLHIIIRFRLLWHLGLFNNIRLSSRPLNYHRLIHQFLNSQQYFLLLFTSNRSAFPCLQYHKLAHHLELLCSNISNLLLMLLLSFHLRKSLTQHHHISLCQTLMNYWLKLFDEDWATNGCFISLKFFG